MAYTKDIIRIDKESANEQRAKRIGSNYKPYWIKQEIKKDFLDYFLKKTKLNICLS